MEQADYHARQAAACLSVLPDTQLVLSAYDDALQLPDKIRTVQHDVRVAAEGLPQEPASVCANWPA